MSALAKYKLKSILISIALKAGIMTRFIGIVSLFAIRSSCRGSSGNFSTGMNIDWILFSQPFPFFYHYKD